MSSSTPAAGGPGTSGVPMPKSKTTPYLIFVMLIVTLGSIQYGYHLAELNAPQDVITCAKPGKSDSTSSSFPQCIPMNPAQFGLVSSSYTVGGFLGAVLAGPLSTRYGRLLTIRLTTIFLFIGPDIATQASSVNAFIAGRFISGLGAGATVVVGPIFISEIAPAHLRGFFGCFTQIGACVGILIAQTVGLFLSYGAMWRVILAGAAAIAIVELLGLLFVPESPIWLADRGKGVLARRILQKIRGKDANIEAEVATWNSNNSAAGVEGTEEESLLGQPASTSSQQPAKEAEITILGALLSPRYRPAIFAVLIVMVGQQFSGINSIVMYSVSLLSPIFPTGASLLVLFVSFINLAMTVLCAPLSDKIGRKACILYSFTGCIISSVLLAIGISFDISIFGALGALLFVASFAMGLGPVPFILASELVGPEAVGAAQSWALGANWVATFIIAQFFPLVNEALGGKGRVYWLFAGLGCVFGGLIKVFVPETLGKEGMDEVWGWQDGHFD